MSWHQMTSTLAGYDLVRSRLPFIPTREETKGRMHAVSNTGPDATRPCRSRVQGTRFGARKTPMGSYDRHPDSVLRVHRADFDREERARRERRGKRHTARDRKSTRLNS